MPASNRAALTLKQFLLRQQVLKLYREFFRTTAKISDASHRRDLRDWVRADFKNNKSVDPNDEEKIKALMFNGEKFLKELKQSVDLAKA